MFAITELPPKLTNGRVTPVSGINRTTPPMITNAWRANTAVRPAASSFEKPSRAITAVLKPARGDQRVDRDQRRSRRTAPAR